jgi:hypothetical protein
MPYVDQSLSFEGTDSVLNSESVGLKDIQYKFVKTKNLPMQKFLL